MTIGEAIKRIEDPRLLVGKGQYVADLSVPGMLEAYVVRSPYAHARIHSIDSAALRAAASYKKSVVTVVTARDLPPNLRPIPMRLTPAPELEHALQMPLAGNIVRYVGEPVAVIVADSRYAAEDAAEQLLIEYEMLPAVVDIHKALPAHAPLVHPILRYLYHRLKKGRCERGSAPGTSPIKPAKPAIFPSAPCPSPPGDPRLTGDSWLSGARIHIYAWLRPRSYTSTAPSSPAS
jgi:aerobic carbon-monoxide dehydrogenase large subunit